MLYSGPILHILFVLQSAHLEALAAGSQLDSLSLSVYQASGVNLRLNPLMQLTGLKSLEVVYKGWLLLLLAAPAGLRFPQRTWIAPRVDLTICGSKWFV